MKHKQLNTCHRQEDTHPENQSNQGRLVDSLVLWLTPPFPGQPLAELEWCWLDLWVGPGEDRRAVVRDERPTPEDVALAIQMLRPISPEVGRVDDSERTLEAIMEAWRAWPNPLDKTVLSDPDR